MALNVAVLISGSGTTLQNLIDRQEQGELDISICCVLSSRAGAFGLERAQNHGIPAIAVPRKEHESASSFNEALWTAIRGHGAELVVLAGFMSLLDVPDDFVNHIMNIHPALIPSFCGKGMYGHHVHEAVLKQGCKVTGVTVHFVDAEYDHGPIVMQEAVPVHDDDTSDSLAERVQAMEREIYPKAIQAFAEGCVRVEGHKVRVL